MKHRQEMKCLDFYEEVIGVLTELTGDEESLIARISKVVLALPLEMEIRLQPLVGKSIGILRTDIPQKEYLVRRISESKSPELEEIGPISPILCKVPQEAQGENDLVRASSENRPDERAGQCGICQTTQQEMV
jgi:hypothetical protein